MNTIEYPVYSSPKSNVFINEFYKIVKDFEDGTISLKLRGSITKFY